jgi:glycosyltransferase involved in cell wall biosynthesis
MDPSQKFGSLEEQMAFLAHGFREESSVFLPLFVTSTAPEQTTPLEKAGVPIRCLDLCRFRQKILRQLLSVIDEHAIDIVHWNFSPPLLNSYLWWLALLRPRLKHYFTDHNSRDFPLPPAARGWRQRVKRVLLKRYAKVFCISQFVLDCLEAQDVWPKPICSKYFINTARFRPDVQARVKVRADLGAENRFVLLTVAHLIREKGLDVALKALRLLPENVILWVVGTGPEANHLRAFAQELGLAERAIFVGPQHHVEPFMQAADCFVCPSLWAEATGLVNLEAQASGLPVIASDVGGIPEFVAEGQTGFLFPVGNATELADRVQRLLADPALQHRFSMAARAWVEEQFSPSARLSDMMNSYRS